MQRLQRRVKDSQQQPPRNVAKTKTFDRRTFLECSSRMIRLVPTLSRRQENTQTVTLKPSSRSNENEMSTFGVADEDESPESDVNAIDTTKMKPVKENCDDKPTCETQLVQEKTSAVSLILNTREQRSTLDVETFGIHGVTMPRKTMTTNVTTATTSCTSATLPPAFTTPKRQSTSGRHVWLTKPLTSFVTFMSNIGGNVDITSYPTP